MSNRLTKLKEIYCSKERKKEKKTVLELGPDPVQSTKF